MCRTEQGFSQQEKPTARAAMSYKHQYTSSFIWKCTDGNTLTIWLPKSSPYLTWCNLCSLQFICSASALGKSFSFTSARTWSELQTAWALYRVNTLHIHIDTHTYVLPSRAISATTRVTWEVRGPFFWIELANVGRMPLEAIFWAAPSSEGNRQIIKSLLLKKNWSVCYCVSAYYASLHVCVLPTRPTVCAGMQEKTDVLQNELERLRPHFLRLVDVGWRRTGWCMGTTGCWNSSSTCMQPRRLVKLSVWAALPW